MARRVSREDLARATRLTPFAPVYKLDGRTVAKTGDVVRMAEAETMKFVRANTDIPVPVVHDAYVDDESGNVVIIMDFIDGENLDRAWEGLSSDERDSVIDQLRRYMRQLRQFKGDFIGGIDGSSCNEQYFCEDPGAYGPFGSEDEFNQGMVRAMKKSRPFAYADWTCDVWLEVMKGHEIVLSHGDLDPRNVLVQDGKVMAILDWEYAGYYPEYWEYCKALHRPEWEGAWIGSRAPDKILQPYLKELSVVWNLNEVIH